MALETGVGRRFGRFLYEIDEGWRRMESVVFALIFKEFKNRAGRDNRLGMLWLVIDPMMMTITMTIVWSVMGRSVLSGVSVPMFIATATAPYSVFTLGTSSVPRMLKANRAFYNYQQVKPFDSVLAEFTLSFTLLIIGQVLLFSALLWFWGYSMNYRNIMPLVGLIGLTAVMSFGIALAVATYGAIYDPVIKVASILGRFMLFASPIFYPARGLPDSARAILAWNPLSHVIEYARFYALGLKPFPEATLSYSAVFALTALFFGLVAYYPNRQRLMQT